jgi:hypothetical protein
LEINVDLTPIKFSILLEHFLDGFFDLFGQRGGAYYFDVGANAQDVAY